MAIWLYPISEKSGLTFDLKDGRKLKTSIENYVGLVQNKKLMEDKWWRLRSNYKQVRPGDEIYIYTGDQDKGIIGWAKVGAVDDEERLIKMGFDFDKCERLISNPISAHLVRQWIHYPRSAVRSLDPFRLELERHLPWKNSQSFRKPKSIELKKLRLRPFKTVHAISPAKSRQHRLIHDTLLKPVAQALDANDFSIGTRNFGKLQVDLVGIFGNLAVIVEGKSNRRGHGRNEARQAFGQLHEYRWLFARSQHKKMEYQLWVAFQRQQEKTVIEFLEDHGILVSWRQNNRLEFSAQSKEKFKQICK